MVIYSVKKLIDLVQSICQTNAWTFILNSYCSRTVHKLEAQSRNYHLHSLDITARKSLAASWLSLHGILHWKDKILCDHFLPHLLRSTNQSHSTTQWYITCAFEDWQSRWLFPHRSLTCLGSCYSLYLLQSLCSVRCDVKWMWVMNREQLIKNGHSQYKDTIQNKVLPE